jgi:Ferritin-like
MIRLTTDVAATLDGTLPGVRSALQHAIELEHATLPTYLYALYSLKPEKNQRIASLMLSVIMEEMLHMALACNILNAVGGHPEINKPDFIPTYPGPLPGGVESDLQVPLSPFSLALIEDVFMVIEEPEDPLQFPVKMAPGPAAQLTIGQFYDRIKGTIVDLAKKGKIFTGDPGYQVTKGLPSTELIAVHDVQSATTAIETIVEQGEGTRTSPLDPQHRPAHYYRYAEILHGKALVPNATPPPDFAYAGEAIQFDSGGVYPVVTNPAVPGYTPGSAAAINNDTFNYTYTSLLNTLHIVFNGQPGQLTAAIGLMESLKELAFAMMSAIPAGPTKPGFHAGPSFQYKPTNP